MKKKKLLGILLFALSALQMNAQDMVIPTAELPHPALTFLKTHFPNIEVKRAVKDIEYKKTGYEVTLVDGTEIDFTEKGEWKEVDGKNRIIPIRFIPKSILDYVKSNYPSASITKISKDLYNIDVNLTNSIELEFDLNGKFLRVDQ